MNSSCSLALLESALAGNLPTEDETGQAWAERTGRKRIDSARAQIAYGDAT